MQKAKVSKNEAISLLPTSYSQIICENVKQVANQWTISETFEVRTAMKLVLATILSNYELALCDRRPMKPARRGVTIAPAGGMEMVVQGRHQSRGQKPQAVAKSV